MNWKLNSLAIIVVIIIILGIIVVRHHQIKQQMYQIQTSIKPLPTLNLNLVAHWNTYSSSNSAYTFKYPSTWVVNKNKTSPYDDITILPKDSFAALMRIQDELSNPPHQAYFATPRQNFNIVEKNILVGKVPAKEYDATYTNVQSNQQNTDIEITLSVNHISYDIQLLNYAEKGTFYNILNTFTFTNPTNSPALLSK
jgi:hypothetical protein